MEFLFLLDHGEALPKEMKICANTISISLQVSYNVCLFVVLTLHFTMILYWQLDDQANASTM